VGLEMPARREISALEIGAAVLMVSRIVRSLRCLSSGGVAREAGGAVFAISAIKLTQLPRFSSSLTLFGLSRRVLVRNLYEIRDDDHPREARV